MSAAHRLTVIVPVLNEAESIAARLAALRPLRERGCELIVADGGSADGTPELAFPHADRLITAPKGRAKQMNAGAALADGDLLLFLHADTELPPHADRLIIEGLEATGRQWGRFDVAITGQHRLLPVIAGFMNRRSRLTGVATGDQGMFMRKAAFEACGGFPEIPLMEDIALSDRLRRRGPPLCLKERALTSGRRWERNGVIPTILLMWRLRLAFFLGADPRRLARTYGYAPD